MDPRVKSIGAKISSSRVPDAVQRERQRSGAPLIRDLREGGVPNDPGSAAHHSASLHAAQRPGHALLLAPMGLRPGFRGAGFVWRQALGLCRCLRGLAADEMTSLKPGSSPS